ncbi:MAG TPA: permease prefix domain 1-containing protein [Pyrinomonadaceae bacterium]|nr:permease prefix domain 1-containing protein [Pyrinomonadaceae bacterium]
MFWIKATTRLIGAWRRPDEVVREVETELRIHIEMRTRANVEQGMRPDEAQRAALQSFGDFERVRNNCCEIRRSLPFDSTPLKMWLHITIAVMAGLAALWAVNVPHHTLTGVMRQLIAIAVLTYLFIVVRRARSKQRFDSEHVNGVLLAPSKSFYANDGLTSDMLDAPSAKITAYDEQGRTPVERVFKS